MTDALIAALLYLYPPRWRQEYGEELQDLLRQRPLRIGGVADVAWNGIRQRLHDPGAGVQLGLLLMAWVGISLAMNVMTPAAMPGTYCADNALRDTAIRLEGPFVSVTHVPSVMLAPGGPEFYALVLMACGFCTRLRETGGSPWRPGAAATQLAALTGLPVMLLGLLLFVGIVDLRVIAPSDGHALAGAARWTFTYCSPQHHAPSALSILTAPLLRLPLAFVYGFVGGGIASWLRFRRQARHG